MKKFKPSLRPALLLLLPLTLPIITGIFPRSLSLRADAGPAVAVTSFEKDAIYRLKDGKILRITSDKTTELPIPGGVLSIFHGKDGLYYLRSAGPDDDGRPRCRAGYYNPETGAGGEVALDVEVEIPRLRRLLGRDGQCYFLLAAKVPGEPGEFYRVDINAGAVSAPKGVLDFILGVTGPVILEPAGPSPRVTFNGRTLPLLLQGDGVYFKEILDGRICFITDGTKTEIVDIISLKSLYVYSDKVLYASPGSYNLTVELMDQAAVGKAGDRVFYRVLIDGVESGRTDTGPPDTPRVFRGAVEPDTYHVVTLERWEINIARKRYERSNNIRQPDSIKIFMPRNLVLGIYFRYDGKTYTRTIQPLPAQ